MGLGISTTICYCCADGGKACQSQTLFLLTFHFGNLLDEGEKLQMLIERNSGLASNMKGYPFFFFLCGRLGHDDKHCQECIDH